MSNHASPTTLSAISARLGLGRRGPTSHPSGRPAFPKASGDCGALEPTFSESRRQYHRRNRRIDLTVGILVALGAHASLVLLSDEPIEPAAEENLIRTTVEVITLEMPDLEETPVDLAESEPSETPPAQFAPPTQADFPSTVSIDSFIQPMQAPVPSGISTDMNMLTVPTTTHIGQGSNAPKLFDMGELDRVPNRIRTAMPNYPQEFRRARVQGDVLLLVVIDPSGRVKVDRVIASTNQEFARAATLAAEQCLYETPIKGGAPVSARYTLKVPFRLE